VIQHRRCATRALISTTVAILLALGVLLVPVAAFAASDPALVCSYTTTASTETNLQFPSTANCNVASLLTTGYDTLEVDITGSCHTATLPSEYVRMKFNGDATANSYKWGLDTKQGGFDGLDPDSSIVVGPMACDYGLNPSNASSSFRIVIPFASSIKFDKAVIFDSSGDFYNGSPINDVQAVMANGGGVWYNGSFMNPGPVAINRIDLFLQNGDKFQLGTNVTVHKR
jgi:hypothetical protein